MYVNVSYNRMDMIGRVAFGQHLPPVERFVLKTDNDVFDYTMVTLQVPAWDRLQRVTHLRLSLAFSNPVIELGNPMYNHALRTLDLDFEGCRFMDDAFRRLVTWLANAVSLTSLSIALGESNADREDVRLLLGTGFHRCGGLA